MPLQPEWNQKFSETSIPFTIKLIKCRYSCSTKHYKLFYTLILIKRIQITIRSEYTKARPPKANIFRVPKHNNNRNNEERTKKAAKPLPLDRIRSLTCSKSNCKRNREEDNNLLRRTRSSPFIQSVVLSCVLFRSLNFISYA